jgi:hypothetical protein
MSFSVRPQPAQAFLQRILDDIDRHRWRDLHVPHGFSLERISGCWIGNPFTPGALGHSRVTVRLAVPVIYSPEWSAGRLKATLPACRENLDTLCAWIRAHARDTAGPLVELVDWEVSPDEAPAPYGPDGTPNGPPPDWSVRAVFDVL